MAIFEASPEGFRGQNYSRPPEHLVRELIQNVFDENATFCNVNVKWTPAKGVSLTVEDNVPGGFRDEKLVFTIWESDKLDSHLKRGRMGRGLKEIVSVSDRTVVRTQGRPAIIFRRDEDGTWSRSTDGSDVCPLGTRISAQIKYWRKETVEQIVQYLDMIRPPSGVTLRVNGQEVRRKPAAESIPLCLPTVSFRGASKSELNPSYIVNVDLFKEGESWVYEMGLPIEKIDYPYSIDIAQRIPLREQRDTLISWVRSILFAKLFNARYHLYSQAEMRQTHVLIAAEAEYHLSGPAKFALSLAWTEGLPFAKSEDELQNASARHIDVCYLEMLPQSIRDIVKVVGVPVTEIFKQRKEEWCPPIPACDLTQDETRLVYAWTKLAAAMNRPITVQVRGGNPPDALADFNQITQTLSIYRSKVPPAFFADPFSTESLSVFVHELSHWEIQKEQHGKEFNTNMEDVGARLASWLFYNSAVAASWLKE